MSTQEGKAVLLRFLDVPEFRALFLREIGWALKGCCDHPPSNEELVEIWEDLDRFEEMLDRAFGQTPSAVSYAAL